MSPLAFLIATFYSVVVILYRSSGSEFLVAGGPTKTWIVGNSLVTITTSGKLVDGESGVCKRCALKGVGPHSELEAGGSSTALGHSPGSTYKALLQTSSSPSSSTSSSSSSSFLGSCWHSGWAEIKIRRSSGNTAWMMQLENRPHPLSLTHPSHLGMLESEVGLLAAGLPPQDVGVGPGAEPGGGVVGNAVVDKEDEDLFYSRDFGSFTDISFASNIPQRLSAGVVGGNRDEEGAKSVGAGGDRGKEGELASEWGVAAPEKGDGGDGSKVVGDGRREGEVRDESVMAGAGEGVKIEMSEGSVGGDGEGETSKPAGEEDAGYTPGLLSICEAAAVVEGSDTDHLFLQDGPDSKPDASSTQEVDTPSLPSTSSPSPNPGGVSSVNSSLASHIRRSANSQSWSEKMETATSPLPITPRAASYSFSMEHLPPLLSYDGGEESNHSPSLNEGGRVMSEEEQVTPSSCPTPDFSTFLMFTMLLYQLLLLCYIIVVVDPL